MNPYDIDLVIPLLEHRERIGDQVKCAFRCPLTGVGAAAGVRLAQPGLLRRLSAIVSGLLGRDAEQRDGDQTLERATLEAFRRVSEHFYWDDVALCWIGKVSADAPGLDRPFLDQLSEAPVEKRFDRQVLQRMLVEVALADDQFSQNERVFLNRLLEREVHIRPITDLHPGPRLTPGELESVSPGPGRETMLMLAHALALCDGLAPAEQRRLDELARALGIDEERVGELHRAAQALLFEKHMEQILARTSDPEVAHVLAQEVAASLRLDPVLAGRWEALHRQLHPAEGVLR